ncbi:MAG: hypothetical protein LBL59_05500 [Xanthomonadaceae bacterium]|jgi:hypothetical protein|nr:hypothetical protein [Xanthomonadaceae bacterium]
MSKRWVLLPTLPERESLQSFVPAGWKLGIERFADLDGDGVDDRVMMIWMEDSARRNVRRLQSRYNPNSVFEHFPGVLR